MDLKLAGKTVIVTGATGGIGLEIARRFSQEGALVTIPGRSQDKLDAAIADILASGGDSVSGVLADPATEAGAAALVSAVADVDVLVNNLGIYEPKLFQDISDAEWRHMFEVNVMSGVRLSRAYMPGMLERDWGRIIFISSESGLMTPGEMVHYGMTKTAQLAVARGLAITTKGTGVTVNSVMPGPTRSDGIFDFLRGLSPDPNATAEELEADFFRHHRPSSLLQRLIHPEEVASLVAYVASPLAAATNGAALRVDGGVTPTIV
jgi:NAD(P)-dependent dehydrogenase (short-subunit alcohol dehydrogenase family)